MTSQVRKFTGKILLLGISCSALACALMGNNDDPAVKSTNLKFERPPDPYEKINVSSADLVWQSKKTGNTIAVNSLCQKYQDVSLKNLEQNILSGVENLKIEKSQTITFDGREAERTLSVGTTDGIAISVDLLILKKNGCTYDLAYIARKSTFSQEAALFEKFLKGFHAP